MSLTNQVKRSRVREAAGLVAPLFVCTPMGCSDDATLVKPDDTLAVVLHPHDGPAATYGGGLYIQLVQVLAPAGAPVNFSATVAPSMNVSVLPSDWVGEGGAEVLLRPTPAQEGQVASFEVRAQSGAQRATANGTFEIITWEDDGPEYADSLLAIFLPYVAGNHGELGLGPDTVWVESWNSQPVLVVTHRSYLNAEWELHVAWHNTIPPYDWAYLTARRRTHLEPEIAFCIPSQQQDHTVQVADLSDPRLPCAE